MKRVIVLGGLGWFGRSVVEQLRQAGIMTLTASRRGVADICVDADSPAAVRAALREGDLVIDAAGPFHARSTALVEAAIDVGFDVIDLNDSVNYARPVLALEPRIAAAGIRVLTSASTVSAIAAAIVRHSGATQPVRVNGFLAPASRYTANVGTARSLLRSVGRPIAVWRRGRLLCAHGWGESRRFPMPAPVGAVCGRLYETADAIHLPRIWPSLHEVAMYVDPRTPAADAVLRIAARQPLMRTMLDRCARVGAWIARRFGSRAGGVGYEIEDADGTVARLAIVAQEGSFVTAAAPVVLAAQAIVHGQFAPHGLVPPDQHADPSELFAWLEAAGVRCVCVH